MIQLTPRQHKTLLKLATGASNRDIADELGFKNDRSVKFYLAQLFDLTGTWTRLELVVWYFNGGKDQIEVKEVKANNE